MGSEAFEREVLDRLITIETKIEPMVEHIRESPKFRDMVITAISQTKLQWYLITGIYISILGSIIWIIRSKV